MRLDAAMNPGPAFDRVYVWLKEQLVSGVLVPGSALEPAHLTEGLSTSITPIRDALHRLAGEGLVDAAWGNGFRVPAPTEAELRTLYSWNLALLDLAVRSSPPIRPIMRNQPNDPMSFAELANLIAWRGGPEHVAAISNLNDRLGPARAIEAAILGDDADEIDALTTALRVDDDRSLRRALAFYHRRRIRAVADIVLAMRTTQR